MLTDLLSATSLIRAINAKVKLAARVGEYGGPHERSNGFLQWPHRADARQDGQHLDDRFG